MKQAGEAVEHFKDYEVIPNMGQRIMHGVGPGDIHVFPDGSTACHWSDGQFTEGELIEETS